MMAKRWFVSSCQISIPFVDQSPVIPSADRGEQLFGADHMAEDPAYRFERGLLGAAVEASRRVRDEKHLEVAHEGAARCRFAAHARDRSGYDQRIDAAAAPDIADDGLETGIVEGVISVLADDDLVRLRRQ